MSTFAGTPKATPTKPATANSSPAPPNFFNTASDTTFTWNQSGKNTVPVPLTSGATKTPAATPRPSAPSATTNANANQSTSSATQLFKFNILTSPRVTMSAPSPSVSSTPVALTKVPTMPPTPVRKHDTYYFTDGSVVIQVDEVLFNLHQSILTLHSKEKFVELGLAFRTYSAPLVLKGVNLKDFECLLGVLYPQTLGIEEETRTVEQWVSIMKQAHMWGIEPLKQRAAKHLTTMSMPPAERVNLYQHCAMGTSPDLLPALLALSQQEAPVALEDARLLGLETFTKLVRIRERRLTDVAWGVEAESTKTLLRGLIQEDILGVSADKPVAQTASLEARGSPAPSSKSPSKPYALSMSPAACPPSTSSSASSPGSSLDDDAVKVEKPANDEADDSGDSDASESDASDVSDED